MKAFEQQMKELEEVEGAEVKLMRTLKAEYRAVSLLFLKMVLAIFAVLIFTFSVVCPVVNTYVCVHVEVTLSSVLNIF